MRDKVESPVVRARLVGPSIYLLKPAHLLERTIILAYGTLPCGKYCLQIILWHPNYDFACPTCAHNCFERTWGYAVQRHSFEIPCNQQLNARIGRTTFPALWSTESLKTQELLCEIAVEPMVYKMSERGKKSKKGKNLKGAKKRSTKDRHLNAHQRYQFWTSTLSERKEFGSRYNHLDLFAPNTRRLSKVDALLHLGRLGTVCLFGDSQIRNSVWEYFVDIFGTKVVNSGKYNNWARPFYETMKIYSNGNMIAYFHDTFGTRISEIGIGMACEYVIFNIGQWPAATSSSLFAYKQMVASAFRRVENIETFPVLKRAFWISTLPISYQRRTYQCPPTDLRNDAILPLFNNIAKSLAHMSSLVSYVDVYDVVDTLRDLSYDGAHYGNPVGELVAQIVLRNLLDLHEKNKTEKKTRER